MKFNLLVIFLVFGTAAFSQINSVSVGESFRQYINNAGNVANSLPTFTAKEETQGSPYLFKNWAKGEVLLKTKQKFTEPEALLNYDKMKQEIILKISDSKVVEVNMEQIESFTLRDSLSSVTFISVPEQRDNFYIQLYRDSLYSLYKLIETRFYKADYVNKGLYEAGNKFDSYVDKSTYFIKPANRPSIPVKNLDKKGLKKIGEEIPAAKSFIDKNDSGSDADNYLTKLTIFLNKH